MKAGARHGTPAGYRDDRCKCDDCRRAISKNHNVYKMRLAARGGRPILTPKLGAERRLRALMAIGWPRRELARQAGYSSDPFSHILNGTRESVGPEVTRRVNDLYERLRYTPGPSSITAARAGAKGWPAPDRWLNIDDPAERPDPGYSQTRHWTELDPIVVDRIVGGDMSLAARATRAERVEVVARWRADGRPLNELERLTGWQPSRYTRKVA